MKSCRGEESRTEGNAGRIESLPAPRGSQRLASPPVLSGDVLSVPSQTGRSYGEETELWRGDNKGVN